MPPAPDFERPSLALVARYRAVRIDVVARTIGNAHVADPGVKPLSGTPHIVGPAFPVAHGACEVRTAIIATGLSRRGDVLMLGSAPSASGSVWGGGLTLSADERGLEAVAVDGEAIDLAAIRECRTPVYARGSSLRSATPMEPGRLAVPIMWGGVNVAPGDLVLGDLDGLCVIPCGLLEELIEPIEAETARIARNIDRLSGSGQTLLDLRGGPAFARDAGFDWPDEEQEVPA